MSEDVVQTWRRRAQLTGRRAWSCVCGAVSLVRRRACPKCGGVDLQLRALAPEAKALAVTNAGATVEHLDQATGRKSAVLLDNGIACLVADVDARTLDGLRGQSLRLVVRRLTLGRVDSADPIPYGLKAAASVATRATLRKKDPKETP